MIKAKWTIFIIISLVIAATVYLYDPWAVNHGWPTSLSTYFRTTGLYQIDPETILASLEAGDANVFLPDPRLLEERIDGPILYDKPVAWNQSDNLKIAGALNQFVWKDDLEDWKLFSMVFNVNCRDALHGVPGGVFDYFRTTLDHGRMAYSWRQIEIDPEYAYAAWGGDAKYAHPLVGWKSIDLSKLKVTAEDAIRIAEEHGGRDARLHAQNRCAIHLLLMPERFKGWLIDYQSAEFEIEVDARTGKIIK